MKLDATDIRYLSPEEFRVLTAVEMGSKNHEIVPTALISQISKLRSGGINKILGSLAKRDLVSRVQNAKYDGYRLTYGGYDYLAIRTLSKRETMAAVGNQIGVGKESDIYIVSNQDEEEMVLKLHRLGRISFRSIKSKRDYLGKRKSATWMYMSRLAAQKEYAFMKILHEHGFPIPRPIDQARHCVLMEFIDAYPLRQISSHPSPGSLYSTLMDLIVRFAYSGLIHGDFNEFNILIRRDTGEPVVIDFPQMVSTRHANAEWYFNRDVECIRTFFRRRFKYESAVYPRFTSTLKEGEKLKDSSEDDDGFRLDVVVAASGFSHRDQEELERYLEANQQDVDGEPGEGDEESEEEEEEGEEVEEAGEDVANNGQDEDEVPSLLPSKHADPVPPDSDHEEEQDNDDEGEGDDADEEADQVDATKFNKRSTPKPPKPHAPHSSQTKDSTAVKNVVSSELTRQRARQEKRYHSKKGVGKAGRIAGSKLKADKRVRLDDGWN